MKAILVATISEEKKLYYIVDSSSKDRDGVLSDEKGGKVVNFWKTATKLNGLKPIKSSNFHKYLWDNESADPDADEDRWKRIFVNKTQKVPETLLSGVQIVTDVLKSKMKSKSIDRRVFEFKSLLETQNISMVRLNTQKTINIDWLEKK